MIDFRCFRRAFFYSIHNNIELLVYEGDVGVFSKIDCDHLMWYVPVTGTLDGTSFVVCSELED